MKCQFCLIFSLQWYKTKNPHNWEAWGTKCLHSYFIKAIPVELIDFIALWCGFILDYPQYTQEHDYFFQKDRWKECRIKDCTELQKLKQRLARHHVSLCLYMRRFLIVAKLHHCCIKTVWRGKGIMHKLTIFIWWKFSICRDLKDLDAIARSQV